MSAPVNGCGRVSPVFRNLVWVHPVKFPVSKPALENSASTLEEKNTRRPTASRAIKNALDRVFIFFFGAM
jgi:hypothetical protein